ncbi:MAG: TatD family hydrolase [Odoribacteraceae bacterium]|jgi:TatD DNase family protein|nr:TatD family hydrolase [Odoribacteraceae bacterium]
MFIDTHAHLYTGEFDPDRDAVIERALAAGVGRVVLPDIDSTTREAELTLAARYPGLMLPLLGIHPTSIREDYRDELAALERGLARHAARGIGECGIDLYREKTRYKEQVIAFEWQLHAARELDLPVIIHSREAFREVVAVLKRQHHDMRGIFHCFPGDAEDARRVIDLGFLLGIGGVVTFKNSLMATVVRETGLDRVVLETDAPYLAPAPRRGTRNESACIPLIAAKIAELTGRAASEVEEITTRNALELFSLQPQTSN